jgi:hypothetical protein
MPDLQLEQAQRLGVYVALHHAPYFLACLLAASAPCNDLVFLQDIRLHSKVDPDMAAAVLEILDTP